MSEEGYRTRQARKLVDIAMETGEDVPTFLVARCGDDEELLWSASALLEPDEAGRLRALMPGTSWLRNRRLGEGDKIGAYTITGVLGEGGFGIVYCAGQERPVRREVALKVLKPGMDSEEVVRRFEAERQALAVMEHRAIAQVFDAGVTEAGLPYCVMELVNGEPLNRFVAGKKMTLQEMLELVIQVCEGVHHAHQRGIIHRDLKPSNVLVRPPDSDGGQPEVKIIDFGIAKAVGQSLNGETFLTVGNRVLGTPIYMSPEQASGNPLLIDTRSDVYALGVMLYELLTGSTPIPHEKAKGTASDEMYRLIREEDPPPPSSRITRGEREASGSHSEFLSALPSSAVKGELDWVTMRALEKDPDRRYGSALELAKDLRRYLLNEPVEAVPPSPIYRFRKYARRNSIALAAAAIVALSLVGATLFSANQAIHARASEKTALAARDDAQGLVDFMLDDLQEKLAPLGRLDILQDVIDEAGAYSSVVTDASHAKAAQLGTLKSLSRRAELGRIKFDMEGIRETYEEGGALVVDSPEVLSSLVGLTAWAQIVETRSRSLRDSGSPRDTGKDLLAVFERLPEMAVGEAGAEEERFHGQIALLGICTEILSLPHGTVEEDRLEVVREQLLTTFSSLAEEFEERPLLAIRMLQHEHSESSRWMGKCMTHLANTPDDFAFLTQFASWVPLGLQLENWKVIEEPLRRAVRQDPSNHALRVQWAKLLSRNAYAYHKGGLKEDALALLHEAIPNYEAVLENNPDLWWLNSDYAVAFSELSRVSNFVKDYETAVEAGARAVELHRQIIETPHPGMPQETIAIRCRTLLFAANHQGRALLGLNRLDEAEKVTSDMIARVPEFRDRMEAASPGFFQKSALLHIHYLYACACEVAIARQNPTEAVRLIREYRGLLPPDDPAELALSLEAVYLRMDGALDEAKEVASGVLEQLVEDDAIHRYDNLTFIDDLISVFLGAESDSADVEVVLAHLEDGLLRNEAGQLVPTHTTIRPINPTGALYADIARRFDALGNHRRAAEVWETVWECRIATLKFLEEEGLGRTSSLDKQLAHHAREAAANSFALGAPSKAGELLQTASEDLGHLLRRDPHLGDTWSTLFQIEMSLATIRQEPEAQREHLGKALSALREQLATAPGDADLAERVIRILILETRELGEEHRVLLREFVEVIADPLIGELVEAYSDHPSVVLAASQQQSVVKAVEQ